MILSKEEYDKFQTYTGLTILRRKAAASSTFKWKISESGVKWKWVDELKMPLTLVPGQYEYKLEHGVLFQQMSYGCCCTTVLTKDGNTFTLHQAPAGNTDWNGTESDKKASKYISEFSDDGIDVQWICDEIKCKQYYKRV